MEIHYCADYEEMSRQAADYLVVELSKKPGQLLCAATGNSPLLVYEKLGTAKMDNPHIFKTLRILKLDEWAGIPMDDSSSCEVFIQDRILKPLAIESEHYISFQSDAMDPNVECERVQLEIEQQGPIDICILGLGINGHIGFLEPADQLMPFCHPVQLTRTSKQHEMVRRLEKKPSFGLTLGIADILCSKKIILLVTGKGKESATQGLLRRIVSSKLPASFLWLHPNVHCYMDKTSLAMFK